MVRFFLCCLYFLPTIICAQDTLNIKDPKPFDIPFILKIPTGNKEKAVGASFFELTRKGCLATPKGCFDVKTMFKSRKVKPHSFELDVLKQDTSGNVWISVPSLEPSKEYLIFLNYSNLPAEMEDFYKLLDEGKDKEAETMFKNIYDKNKITLKTRYETECNCEFPTFTIGLYKDQFNFFSSSLKKYRTQRITFTGDKKTLNDQAEKDLHKTAAGSLKNDFLKDVLGAAQKCTQCKDTLWEFQWAGKGNDLLQLFMNFSLIKEEVGKGFLEYRKLQTPTFVTVKDFPLDKRIANLGSSISDANEILEILDYLGVRYSISDFAANRKLVSEFVESLSKNFNILNQLKKDLDAKDKEIQKQNVAIDKAIASFEGLWLPASALLADTYTYGFTTRSGYIIKPDFGFMTYGNLGANKGFWGVAPYLGFHVNFRPLNTDIGFYKIKHKGVLGHLSFTGGALIGSVKEEGKRDGLVGNTAIFTGLGIAFGHAARINTGTVWYRKNDPNPLITAKSVAATPYIGLSIDLRLRDIYDAFTKLFN